MTDTDIHSCGYYCDRHACIVAQRNELRDKLFGNKEWVGLTAEELQEISDFHFHGAFSGREIYEDIETRLKEKNGN